MMEQNNIINGGSNENQEIKGISVSGLKQETDVIYELLKAPSNYLNKILMTSEKIKSIKEKVINFSDPILKQNGNAIIFPHTINVIQGQPGTHKSRLAEFICASMLKRNGNENELLGYRRVNFDANHTIVYVDTERNLSEQFPYALQSIQIKAGYDRVDHPSNFKYISLLEIPRKDRYSVLNEFLDYLKKETSNSLFIVLDVSTDCIEDFNRSDKSMELIDLMNVTINEHDVVFLCLIHENPKSEKARGHFGTELMNKASTVMQVSYEKDSNNNDTDLIKIRYLKCRSTARHNPFFAKYSEESKGLVLADSNDIQTVMSAKKQKADIRLVIEHLEMYLGDGTRLSRRELLDTLIKELGSSEKTIEDRLKEIYQNRTIINNENGIDCYLEKDKRQKEIKYYLEKAELNSETID